MGGGGQLLTSAKKVGGSKKGQKHADVILEWSPILKYIFDQYIVDINHFESGH